MRQKQISHWGLSEAVGELCDVSLVAVTQACYGPTALHWIAIQDPRCQCTTTLDNYPHEQVCNDMTAARENNKSDKCS
jgi:hypothetical protein